MDYHAWYRIEDGVLVNALNLHIIDLAKKYHTHLKEKLRKKKQERKNGRILINCNE
jgi:hypothetical protein